MAADDAVAEAALELSILSVDTFPSSSSFTTTTTTAIAKKKHITKHPIPIASSSTFSWWNPNRHYAVAWLDPLAKQSTGTLDDKRATRKNKLYFPLSSRYLDAAAALITIEVFSPSRVPFHSTGKLVGSAVLPLSSVRMAAETFLLPLWRPSGRAVGSIRVSARVLWDLGFRPQAVGVEGIGDCRVVEQLPSAPVADFVIDDGGCYGFDPSAPGICDSSDSMSATDAPTSHGSATSVTKGGSSGSDSPASDRRVEDQGMESVDLTGAALPEGGGDQGKVLVGLIGAFTAVVLGVACHRLKVKPFFLIG